MKNNHHIFHHPWEAFGKKLCTMGRRSLSDLGNLVVLEGRLLGEGPDGPDILKKVVKLDVLTMKDT